MKALKKRACISYTNKCIQAKNSFFLLSDEDEIYQKIGDEIFLKGIIVGIPRKGKTNEFKIILDSSTNSVPTNDAKLHLVVSKDDTNEAAALKPVH